MDLQEAGVVAAGHPALMAVPAQDFATPGRRDGVTVRGSGAVDLGIALDPFQRAGGKRLTTAVRRDLGLFAGGAIMDVDLVMGPLSGGPPGGLFQQGGQGVEERLAAVCGAWTGLFLDPFHEGLEAGILLRAQCEGDALGNFQGNMCGGLGLGVGQWLAGAGIGGGGGGVVFLGRLGFRW